MIVICHDGRPGTKRNPVSFATRHENAEGREESRSRGYVTCIVGLEREGVVRGTFDWRIPTL